MSSFKRDKKEEDVGGSPYNNLDKTIVLQESRYFNQSPVIPKKCTHILSKILFLLNQGEKFTTQEATDAFFATTKLFQSKDVMLRRMVYLCIKELSKQAQDVIIVTSSLTKDMTGKEDLYRAAAIRTLCSITDSTMLQAIERYMKQAIVDKNSAVCSAALVSAVHLSAIAPDLIRRWVTEAQEAIFSENATVSYHALGVMAVSRKNDKLATFKLVYRLTKIPLKSPYTICLLIRLAAKLVEDDDQDTSQDFIEFIESCLRHKSEMVIYEAAHAIVNLRKTAKNLTVAISVLQLFCGSCKPSLRLAGVRTLARLTRKHPTAVAACTVDLENLITDTNRSIATLAVTTLLATGTESSIDRLMKQISSFMSEISDEFKIVVVQAIRQLCIKFPRKHQSLAAFLAGMLRDEGGLEYKAAIADAIIALVEQNPEEMEIGLSHLCEFIEDCEHTALAVRILHLLGREGPKSRQPSRYIRFIYNRVILESAPVRAAAVSAVAQFGAQRSELLQNVRVLLSRCQLDDEDEVRDRAIYYSAILDTGDEQLFKEYIINIPKLNPVLLEKSLRDHLATDPTKQFDILTVPEEEVKKEVPVETEVKTPAKKTIEEAYLGQLAKIPGIEKLGPLFKTTFPIELTEPEMEYRVHLLKHIYSDHVILQFECLNTLHDQLLEQVHVTLDLPPEYEIRSMVPSQQLSYNKLDSVFVILNFPSAYIDSLATFGASLDFVVKDCDPETGLPDAGEGYPEVYQLEQFEIECSDQIKTRAASENWEESWHRAANVIECSDTFILPQTDVTAAASSVCEHLGLSKKAIIGDSVKEIRGGAIFRGGAPVLIRAKLVTSDPGVTMKLAARSLREDVAQLILAGMN